MSSGNTTGNSQALIIAQAFSKMVLKQLTDGLLPTIFTRNVDEFKGEAGEYIIPNLGTAIVRPDYEDKDTELDNIDAGRLRLKINKYKSSGWYITEEMMESSAFANVLVSEAPVLMAQAMAEVYETDMLATSEVVQVQGQDNAVNGFAHRWVATGPNQTFSISDVVYMKLAFDKANLPSRGRVAIVDACAEASINSLPGIISGQDNPEFRGIVETGFGADMRFLREVMGIKFYVSNRLPRVSGETVVFDPTTTPVKDSTGAPIATGTIVEGVVCAFMSIANETTKPYMDAWARKPKVTHVHDGRKPRDELYLRSRYGFAAQRSQALGTVIINANAY